MSLDVIITEWALQSYLELKARGVFTTDEYRNTLRPDLCQAYAKDSPAKDKREAAKLLLRVDLIQSGHYEYRGRL